MHRYHFLDDMLLCAAVDGTARLVPMEAAGRFPCAQGTPNTKLSLWRAYSWSQQIKLPTCFEKEERVGRSKAFLPKRNGCVSKSGSS